MDIETVEVILTVAQCENYTEAAQMLGYTPSAISKRVSRAEKELGVELFVRGKKSSRLVLTPVCRSMVDDFATIRESWSDITQKAAQAVSEAHQSTLRVGSSEKHWISRNDEIVAHYIAEQPSVHVIVTSAPWAELSEHLLQGRLDMAFVTMVDDFLQYRSVQRDGIADKFDVILVDRLHSMYLAISENAPEAALTHATLRDFADYAIAFNEEVKVEDSVVRAHIEPFLQLSKRYGFTLKTVVVNTRQPSAFIIARKGGVAIPTPVPVVNVPGIASVPLSDWPSCVSEYCVVPKGKRSDAVARMLSLVEQMRIPEDGN
ncbi:MAG: LysR family transcriptional regulator [Coriobacteriales bacterium]|nr:LysR family transcriptional regulator [Coriobacteriales bacterium]